MFRRASEEQVEDLATAVRLSKAILDRSIAATVSPAVERRHQKKGDRSGRLQSPALLLEFEESMIFRLSHLGLRGQLLVAFNSLCQLGTFSANLLFLLYYFPRRQSDECGLHATGTKKLAAL